MLNETIANTIKTANFKILRTPPAKGIKAKKSLINNIINKTKSENCIFFNVDIFNFYLQNIIKLTRIIERVN